MHSLALALLASLVSFMPYVSYAASTTATASTTDASVMPNTTTTTALPFFANSPDFAGTGCKARTDVLTFQPNQQSFSLNLPPMEVGTKTGQSRRVTCNLVMPVSVPQGYQVALMPLHFAGTVEGSTLQVELRREYFFAGSLGNPLTDTLSMQNANSVDVIDSFTDDSQWAKCGESVNLRANISLRVITGEGQAHLSLTSTDTAQPTVFSLIYRACN